MNKRETALAFIRCAITLAILAPMTVRTFAAEVSDAQTSGATSTGSANNDPDSDCYDHSGGGSPYIPVDSWVYPAVMRLYSLGFIDTIYLNMRPWTRASLKKALGETSDYLADTDPSPVRDEAEELFDKLTRELQFDAVNACQQGKPGVRVESIYSVVRGISGTPLRDSFHLGSTIVNDYGRPYENGPANYSGASAFATAGRFMIYARGEFQGARSSAGYDSTLTATLASLDGTTFQFNPECWLNQTSCTLMPPSQQTTMQAGPIAATTKVSVLEAYVSAQYLGHVFSFGKQDEWLGPGVGGGMAYSNNAENAYLFHITRIEPVDVPFLSRLTGPFRYEFMVGPLKGHTYPKNPWVHVEKVSFRPTQDLEFGFERTVIWGGQLHEPITPKSFLRSFFSLTAPEANVKDSPSDPGARFGAFDFSYRLPFVRDWLTLYSDSEVHDDVSPIDAPRRSCWRPGLYLSHVPGIPKLDMRIEGVSSNPPIRDPNNNLWAGKLMYWEAIQRQGYTNKGQMFGDWIGREAKGGQGWITYHLSGNEWVQLGIRNQKTAADFIPGGTTLNNVDFQVVKRIGHDLEINGRFTYEHWKAPIYLPGQQTVTATTVQLTWFPGRKVSF